MTMILGATILGAGGEQMDDRTFYRIAASVHEMVSDVEFAELVDVAASAHDRD